MENNERKPGESIRQWRDRIRALKQDNTVYYDQEITPAIATAPSKETEMFFDDFIDRYNKNRFFKLPKWMARRKLNNIRTQRLYPEDAYFYDENGERQNSAGQSYSNKPLIELAQDQEDYAYRHEITHQFNDRDRFSILKQDWRKDRLRSLPTSRREIDLLNSAYSLHNTQAGSYTKELFTVNTGIRDQISRANGNILGKKLNDKINTLSDDELMDFVLQQGYIDPDSYQKDYYDSFSFSPYSFSKDPENYDVMNEFSWNNKRYGYNPQQINNIRKALIEVRKSGGLLNK